ncbi:MAG: ABC transporter substrate-binding protein [Alcanivoracaceae bacterium]|nr:ABC transporter substrate-binding protein [Alcanivoracaceae bacterium]
MIPIFLKNKPVSRWHILCVIVLFLNLISCDSEKIATNLDNKIKIISLAPHLTDLTQSAGAINNLVGVVSYADSTTSEFDDIQIVGDAFKLDYESIIALKPDYILSWKGGTPIFVIEKLKSLNFNLIETEINTLADIPKTIAQIASLTNTHDDANKNIMLFNEKLTELKNQNHQRQSTFIETYNKPLYTVSAKHWMSEAASICGYENIFQNMSQLSATVTLEAVISKNPQSIINISPNTDEQWQQWQDLAAVKNKQIITISPDYFSRPSMQLLKGIAILCDF